MMDDQDRRIAARLEAAEAVESEMPAETLAETDMVPDAEDGEAPPRTPRAGGYSSAGMNERWALVLMGSRAVVMHEQPDAPIEERHAVRSIEAFKAWHANRFTEVVADGEIKRTTWATRWIADPKRRQYSGIVFHPLPDGGDGSAPPAGYFNLWRGFSYQPKKKKNGYSIFRDHLFTNVCGGSQKYFDWLFAWMAHIVQRPRERIGTAVVLRGKMGTGKTKVGETFGALFASHFFMVDDPRYVTGQFNAHMASCLLLMAEEAVWAGDKAAEGRLKGLVTSKFQMIEAKGVDPIRLDNYVRLMMSSNEGWVVPAGKDERRFAVFDVGDGVAQNIEYFREMDQQLSSGGYEALLYDLIHLDLRKVDLRTIPKTDALLEQKLRSLDSPESWWFERLKVGTPTRKSTEWPAEVPREGLFDDYLEHSDRIGIKRRATDSEVGMALRRLMPNLKTVRRYMVVGEQQRHERVRLYVLPSLAEARRLFEAAVGQAVDWEDPDPEQGPEDGRDKEQDYEG